MRRSALFTAVTASVLFMLAGCAGDRRETQVARSNPAPFVRWAEPQATAAEAPALSESAPPPVCRMWLESTPRGIAIRFEPDGDSTLAELREELRVLSARLRDVDRLGQPEREGAPDEEVAAAPAEPEGEADEKNVTPAPAPVAAAPNVSERSESEQAAGSIESIETAAEAADMLRAGRAETQGLREIMAFEPSVGVEPARSGMRLVFTAQDAKTIEPLRASVRWHAADLLPDRALAGDGNECVRLPAVVAASAAETAE